jgi:hypothetical protein
MEDFGTNHLLPDQILKMFCWFVWFLSLMDHFNVSIQVHFYWTTVITNWALLWFLYLVNFFNVLFTICFFKSPFVEEIWSQIEHFYGFFTSSTASICCFKFPLVKITILSTHKSNTYRTFYLHELLQYVASIFFLSKTDIACGTSGRWLSHLRIKLLSIDHTNIFFHMCNRNIWLNFLQITFVFSKIPILTSLKCISCVLDEKVSIKSLFIEMTHVNGKFEAKFSKTTTINKCKHTPKHSHIWYLRGHLSVM